MSSQLAEFEAAGMDAYVAKPVEAARLFAVIEDMLAAPETDRVAVPEHREYLLQSAK